jgi:hypothetical protein
VNRQERLARRETRSQVATPLKGYADSSEFTNDLETVRSLVSQIKKIIDQPRWMNWMRVTDENYSTYCEAKAIAFNKGLKSFEELDQQMSTVG